MRERLAVTGAVDQGLFDAAFAVCRAKWAVPVLIELRAGSLRFSQIEQRVGPVSHKALAEALRLLEREGLVERHSFATVPPRVDYAITEGGEATARACEALLRLAEQRRPEASVARRRFDDRHAG